MSSTTLFRLSGLALIIALPLHIVGFVLHPPTEHVHDVIRPIYGPAHLILFVSWFFALLGLPGLYAWQATRAGVLGLIGFVLTMLATAYHCYLLLYESFVPTFLAGDPATQVLIEDGAPLAHGAAGAMGPLSSIAFALVLAFPVLGIATVRAGILPRWSGWLQVASVPVLFLGAMIVSPDAPAPLGTMAAAPIAWMYFVLFIGYAVGGYALWMQRDRAQEPVLQTDVPQPVM